MTEIMQPIPARLKNVAVGGHVAGADQIIDDQQNKTQETINSEVIAAVGTGGSVDSRIAAAVNVEKTRAEGAESALDGRVDTLEDAVGTGGSVDSRISAAVAEETTRAQSAESNLSSGKADKATTLAGYGITDAYTKSETYTKTEVNGLVDTPHQEYITVDAYANLPATGSKDTIYRVSNYNGSTSQVDASVYSEYAWDGSQYVFLCVKSQIGEVFDISVYNNNAKYADLAAALNGGANIPQSLQKGGMSVKFVCSSDNKYVQYRLMADTFSTTVSDWQGIDEEPIVGSENLVKSSGIYNTFVKKTGVIDFEFNITSEGSGNTAITKVYIPAGEFMLSLFNKTATSSGSASVKVHFVDDPQGTYTNIGGENIGINSSLNITTDRDADSIRFYMSNAGLGIMGVKIVCSVDTKTPYIVCDTASDSRYKECNKKGFSISTSNRILIKMTNIHTGNVSVTLDINNTGRFPFYYNGAYPSTTNSWAANEVLDVYFDGAQYNATLFKNSTTFDKLREWILSETFTLTSVVRENDNISSAVLKWPDGKNGTLIVTRDSNEDISSVLYTYLQLTATYSITRDSNGDVSATAISIINN